MALRLAGIGSPEEKIGQLSQENVSSSANTVSFRANVTGYSGIVTGDSGRSRKIGHLQSESAVTFGRNNRSRSNGISGQIGAEYAQSEADQALAALGPLPESSFKEGLSELARFAVARKN
jgi:hypothetical protein